LKDKRLLIKRYKIRAQGWKGRSIVTTIPREVIEREARRLGMDVEEAIKNLEAVWRYNFFQGLYLTLERMKPRNK